MTIESKIANKPAKKRYAINPVITDDDAVKFNHLDILITDSGELRIDGFFQAKRIETAYRQFRNIMAQAANDITQLNGWGYEAWLPANKISECDGNFFTENGDFLFTNNDPQDTLAVDIIDDQFYFFANFSAVTKPLDGFNYDSATQYTPQTNWVNPHDFSVTGDLSERNINGRIIAQRQFTKGEHTLHDDFNDKLAKLQANANDAKANLAEKQAALDKAQQEFLQADAALEDANRAIIQLGEQAAAQLQPLLPSNFVIDFDFFNLNFIVSTLNGTSSEPFDTYETPEQVKDAIAFRQHLLALKKEQEDAYPEEVKALNRDLAQSNLTAPHMWLRIFNNGSHVGSFSSVSLNKLHVKSFITDKIHFNICYACEPLEHYDSFEQVTRAINLLIDAINRGAPKFTFPTADELNQPSATDFTSATDLQKAFWDGTLPATLANKIRVALKKARDAKRDRIKKSGRTTRCRLVISEVNAVIDNFFADVYKNNALLRKGVA